MNFLEKSDRIFVAGSNGMVGSAICKLLQRNGYTKTNKYLLTSRREELDLTENKARIIGIS